MKLIDCPIISFQTSILQDIIKLSKIKDKKNTKDNKKDIMTYKRTPIRLSADVSVETLKARREWNDILKVLKKNIANQEYPVKLSLSNEGETKTFPDK